MSYASNSAPKVRGTTDVTKGVNNLETQILYLKEIGEMTESLDSSADYAGGRGCSWLF